MLSKEEFQEEKEEEMMKEEKNPQCFTTFKEKLKTHLFAIHLCWSAS